MIQIYRHTVVVVQLLSHVQLFATPWTAACWASLSFTISHLPELAQTHVHWVYDAIQLSHPLLPTSPALNLSQHQSLFQWVGSLHRWPKFWCFSLSISPSFEYSGLISFRIDWFGEGQNNNGYNLYFKHLDILKCLFWMLCVLFFILLKYHD